MKGCRWSCGVTGCLVGKMGSARWRAGAMPELPEVETMVRGLRPALFGRTLRRLEVLDPFLLQAVRRANLRGTVAGRRSSSVTRRGKWVVMDAGGSPGDHRHPAADDGRFLAGRAPSTRPHPPGVPRGRTPSDGLVLRHAAAGQDRLVSPMPKRRPRAFARSHGPDALEIGRDDLAERLTRTARGIKPALMDQKVLAGIGNIYADEILHRAGIHPERPAATLRRARDRPPAPRHS